MDTAKLTEFATLHAQKQELEREVKRLQEQMAIIESQLLEMWGDAGVSLVRVDTQYGRRSCHIKRTLWTGATDGQWEAACQALKNSGDEVLRGMVQERFNIQTMSAWVRERLRDEMGLPPIFKLAFEEGQPEGAPLTVIEKFAIGVRKS